MAAMRLRAPSIALLAIAVLVTGGYAASRTPPDARTPLASAAELLAPNTRIASFTDWAKVRKELGVTSFADGTDREAFLLRAHEEDMSYRSLLEGTALDMHKVYGWSPFNIDWEIYGQADDGALLAAGMGSGLSGSSVEDSLRANGYKEADGIWSSTTDNRATVAPGQPTALAHIAVLGGERLILASDSADYLLDSLTRHRENTRSLADVRSVRGVLAPLSGAVSAAVLRSKDACEMANLAEATAAEKSQAKNLVEPLGPLAKMSHLGQGLFTTANGQRVRYAMEFGSATEASQQVRIRRELTTGTIVGRVAEIEDFMAFDGARTRDNTAILDFAVGDPTNSAITEIGDGPMLFAACSPS